MADPQLPIQPHKGLRFALRAMLFIGLLALAYVFLQSLNVPKSSYERFAEGSLRKLTVLNSPPPQPTRTFTGPDNEMVSLKKFRGKYVLVNVWATWCAPCIAEIPSLNQLQKERGSDYFEVVAISMDRQRVDAESFLISKGIDHLELYHDPTLGIGSDFEVAGLPITVLYDPQGRELARLPGEANWQSAEAQAFLRAALP